jgi:LPPG:FO 2-phospho-L-lactate transferase
MQELGIGTDPLAIARHYAGLIDGLLIDAADRTDELAATLARDGIALGVENTLMRSLEDRERIARAALELARALQPGSLARSGTS